MRKAIFWAAVLLNIAVVLGIGWTIWRQGLPNSGEVPLITLILITPPITLLALSLKIENTVGQSWLRLEIEARKAKLRRQIKEHETPKRAA
jgi:cytochrome b subunit of formate dehydrogenase